MNNRQAYKFLFGLARNKAEAERAIAESAAQYFPLAIQRARRGLTKWYCSCLIYEK